MYLPRLSKISTVYHFWMRLPKIVDMGKYQDKMHNSENGNASFGEPMVNNIVMIGLDVKANY